MSIEHPALAKPVNDDEILSFTQEVRMRMISDLTANGTRMPTDPKEAQQLAFLLSDMDRQAATKKRLRQDAQANDTAVRATATIAAVLDRLGARNPFALEPSQVIEGQSRVIEMPDKLVDDVKVAPGELEIGIADNTYSGFMQEFDKR